ncbi:hypothetical protein FACS1894113_0970 [Alphaproteobacteria bacterium]|nr:hypothetical protein FACS1894113_0970 [Alphaproteobacteria bacterium]
MDVVLFAKINIWICFAAVELKVKKFIEIDISSRVVRIANGSIKERYRYKMPDSWTVEEFEKLKELFSNGKKIRTMAMAIGRSVSAVNKFLSRSGIRKARSEIRKIVGRKKYKLMHKFNATRKDVGVIPSIVIKKEANSFSTFSDIIDYIVSKGHTVRKNRHFGSSFYKNEEYILDEKPITKAKLLFFANKLRVEEGKPVFKIMEFIW